MKRTFRLILGVLLVALFSSGQKGGREKQSGYRLCRSLVEHRCGFFSAQSLPKM